MNLIKNILIIVSVTVPIYANELKEVSLQLQWKYQFQFAGYIMAKEKGFYTDIGLDVNLKEWVPGINVINEIIDGKSEYAILRPTSMIDISKGKDIIYLAVIYQSSPLILLTSKDSGIKTIKDFKNKKMMTTGDLNTDTSLISMMFSQGIKLEDLKIQTPSFDVQDLMNGKTDLMASYISNEPFRLKELGGEPVIFSPKDYGFDFYNDIVSTSQNYINKNPKEVKNFTQATLQGWEYAFANIDETVNIIYNKYNLQKKSKESLYYEAKKLKELAYFQTKRIGKIEKKKLEKIYDVYRLLGYVKNEINFSEIVYNKLVLDEQPSNESKFSRLEREYLSNKNKIKICVLPNWLPFEQIDENGNHKGIGADIMKLVSKYIEKPIVLVHTKEWSESLQNIRDRKCDVLPVAMNIPSRRDAMNFTKPYTAEPFVIATKVDEFFIKDSEAIGSHKIGIVKSYAFIEVLKQKNPGINIITVKNAKEGLTRVQSGELYGYVDIMPAVGYTIQKYGMLDLKIAGKLEFDIELSVASRNDEPLLNNIMQKALDDISSERIRTIVGRWISIKVQQSFDYTKLFYVVAFFSFIILLIVSRNRSITKINRKLALANKAIKEQQQKSEELTLYQQSLLSLFDKGDAVVCKWKNNESYTVDYVSLSIQKLTGYPKEDFMLGKISYFECIHKDDFRRVNEKIIESLSNKIEYFKHEPYRLITKEGEEKWIIDYKVTQKDLHGNISHCLGYLADITEHVKNQKMLAEQLKMVSLGEMIGNISHQWRQPLSVISTAATGTMLYKDMNMLTDEQLSENLNQINQNAQYLSKTIDDFKNFIKGDRKLIKFNLMEKIHSFLNVVQTSISTYQIHVIEDCQENIIIENYSNDMIQALINIFNNSKDALVDLPEEERYFFITTTQNEDNIIITLKDNAGGIDLGIIDKVFEPYTTTKHQSQGTGLGLNITYNFIVKGMNGNITVENIQFTYNNKTYLGAEFKIYFPV